ncbi:hypothetical protein [Planctomicrobium piriforme]|uniref:Uncharacterized protein n=1 Tax=Planctomicrobium piriforme TaxID=1576369 RepID=A0A1I3IIY7_9PLAN|nr:hypothetical protein [Planctomicrobium piriforme]SFI47860.1 hypothetical protein SAMN05421753_109143 [Planctomicrobium piriforme]
MRLYFLALGTLLIVCVGCAVDGQQVLHKNEYHAPPAEMMAHPGPMVGGPGPGVMGPHLTAASHERAMGGPAGPGYGMPMNMSCPPSGMACPPGGGGYGPPPGMALAMMAGGPPRTSQVRFLGPEGMTIGWQIGPTFAENQLIAPDRFNFVQGATYRLKFAGIPGREGLTIYPSLHVYPVQPQTAAYLEHNALPLRVTDEDLDQIETNNFVTKVIYLPDARFQELAVAGVEELVSTRLGPGLDPVAEADRRGTIMAVLRMGNMDLEMPGAQGMLMGQRGPNGEVQQTAGLTPVNGEQGQFVPPVPVGSYLGIGQLAGGVPGDLMMGGPAGPGMPPYDPIVGVNGVPMYGYPNVGTPIGLPGPPHIPLGRPAGLQSHTMRNTTDYNIPRPVDHMLIDVRHEPGLSLPEPVKYMQYTEKHPVYQQGEVSMPAWAAPQQ